MLGRFVSSAISVSQDRNPSLQLAHLGDHSSSRFAHDPGQKREPLLDGGRIIVRDVVDPSLSALDRSNRC